MNMVDEPQQQQRTPQLLGISAMTSNPELSRWTLDSSDLIQMIEVMLKGGRAKYDDRGFAGYDFSGSKEIVNEYARQKVSAILHTFLQRNIFLADFAESQIVDIALNIHQEVGEFFLLEWERCGFASPEQVPLVVNIVTTNVWASLSRAKNGHTWSELNRIHSVQEMLSHQDQSGGSNMLNIFRKG